MSSGRRNSALAAVLLLLLCGCLQPAVTNNPAPSSSPATLSRSGGTLVIPTQTATPTSPPAPNPLPTQSSNANVMALTVNGSTCGANAYLNEPCVSVTICTPGTSNCQTINNLLLDTGSYGLRIFSSVITVPLTQVVNNSGLPVADCVSYGDGSSDWGPVKMAGVILGAEPPVQVPIHVIDANFATVPSACGTPDASPAAVGFNGILGVGLMREDCGTACATSANLGIYYACSGSSCTGTSLPLTSQVQNPVALLPIDNNGVIMKLPAVSVSGASSSTGSLILGIGTQSNNQPSGVKTFPADSYANFITVFNGKTYSESFIDSGSNLLFLPSISVLPDCGGGNSGFYCPRVETQLSATTQGFAGTPAAAVNFEVGNFSNLYNSGNRVFMNVGANNSGGVDFGLPFFLGRSVYVGIQGRTSSLGTGPYWAY